MNANLNRIGVKSALDSLAMTPIRIFIRKAPIWCGSKGVMIFASCLRMAHNRVDYKRMRADRPRVITQIVCSRQHGACRLWTLGLG